MQRRPKIITAEEKDLFYSSQQIANKTLTLATLILVVVNIVFSLPYAPFIILLMSSRIASTLFLVIKKPSKKNIIWIVVWLALMAKSLQSYITYLINI